jgi:hypothetical protein
MARLFVLESHLCRGARSVLRSFTWLAVAAALTILPSAASAEKRALVVGVNAYDNLGQDRQLEKAVNDARAIGKALKALGFQVDTAENVDRRGFNKAWSEFVERIEPRDVVAFQFSGHGVEIDGANYLVLRDAPKPDAGAKTLMTSESIGVDRLLKDLQERHPQVSLLILDACRDNPFDMAGRRAAGGTRGLARVDPPEGAFVMLSAGARQSALDRLPGGDRDPNSIYTRKLLPLLTRPGLSLVDVAQEVRAGVRNLALSAQHEQTPAYYDQLTGKFYLAGVTPGGSSAPTTQDRPQNQQPDPAVLKQELDQLREEVRQRKQEEEQRPRQQQAVVAPPPAQPSSEDWSDQGRRSGGASADSIPSNCKAVVIATSSEQPTHLMARQNAARQWAAKVGSAHGRDYIYAKVARNSKMECQRLGERSYVCSLRANPCRFGE